MNETKLPPVIISDKNQLNSQMKVRYAKIFNRVKKLTARLQGASSSTADDNERSNAIRMLNALRSELSEITSLQNNYNPDKEGLKKSEAANNHAVENGNLYRIFSSEMILFFPGVYEQAYMRKPEDKSFAEFVDLTLRLENAHTGKVDELSNESLSPKAVKSKEKVLNELINQLSIIDHFIQLQIADILNIDDSPKQLLNIGKSVAVLQKGREKVERDLPNRLTLSSFKDWLLEMIETWAQIDEIDDDTAAIIDSAQELSNRLQ